MAYANLLNMTCAGGKAEFFCRLRDFLCKRSGTYDYSTTGIGWTLHDSSYAVDENNPQLNDWFVISSPGESGREQLYFLIKWISSTYIQIQGWLYWDNSTHVGVQYYINSTNIFSISDSASNPQLWLYGDLNSFFIGEMTSANGIGCPFGKLESMYESEDIGYCSSSVTAGSDKSITVDIDLPADWVAGAGIYVWDRTNVEKTTIKTVNAGTKTITVDISNAYEGTFRVSRFLGYINASGSSMLCYALCNKAGTKATAINSPATTTIVQYVDTLDNANRYWIDTCCFSSTGGVYGKLRNIVQWYPVSPVTHKDVLVDDDSVEWRCFIVNSNKYIACKEI